MSLGICITRRTQLRRNPSGPGAPCRSVALYSTPGGASATLAKTATQTGNG